MSNHPNRKRTGLYGVWVSPNYYGGDIHGNDRCHFVTHDYTGEIILVRSMDEAQRLATMLNDPGDGPYILANNQYAPPDYEAREYRGTSHVRPVSLEEAMCRLCLQYDFRPDGTRIEVG